MPPTGFDKLAYIYDGLARLVYGKSIVNSQLPFLNDINPNATVLILGGGTGWFLAQLLIMGPTCEIWYIESSIKMLEKSKAKSPHSPNVHFIHGTEQNIPHHQKFDVVITNFYFDLFSFQSLQAIIKGIQISMKPDSIWLATDFIHARSWWQSILSKVMYIFFRSVCNIEAKSLPDWHRCLTEARLIKRKSKLFYGGFIEACVYQV